MFHKLKLLDLYQQNIKRFEKSLYNDTRKTGSGECLANGMREEATVAVNHEQPLFIC
jgi:hypothetical protein